MNILIIEKDPEMQSLYNHFFKIVLPHVSFTVVDGINKVDLNNSSYSIKEHKNSCRITNDKKFCNLNLAHQSIFDVIILDINVENIRGIEIAKEIIRKIPRQKIIFTTTYNIGEIKKKMENEGILLPITILQKPFRFSDLHSFLLSIKGRIDILKLTDHVLVSYSTTQEKLMDVVEFIKKGVASNEMSLLLISQDMDFKYTVFNLKSKGLPNIDTLLEDKSLVIIKNEEWYIPDGKVDKHRIINQWQDLVNQSIQNGMKGLRAFCMMDCFFENGFSTELVDYECTLPSQFQIPFIPICAYRESDLASIQEQDKKKLIECHNHILMSQS